MGKRAWIAAGGGSRGIFQAGSLKYLIEAGYDYDCLYGISVGSINATQVQGGGIDHIEQFWSEISTKNILKKSWWDKFKSFKRGWIHSSDPLREYLKKNVNIKAMKANPREFWINATDYTNKNPYTKEVHSLTDYEVINMVLASASPPVYMPPVWFGDRWLVDGGCINNFALTQAIQNGCDDIILILCSNNEGTQEPGNLVDVLQEVMGMTMNSYLEREMKCIDKVNDLIDKLPGPIKPKKIKLTVIQPQKQYNYSFLDFDFKGLDRKAIIQDGYDTAKRILNGQLP